MTGWMIWCSRADPTAPINRIDLPQKKPPFLQGRRSEFPNFPKHNMTTYGKQTGNCVLGNACYCSGKLRWPNLLPIETVLRGKLNGQPVNVVWPLPVHRMPSREF
jgi:hypothetical protein